jgi:signal transduction histidine kinase/DNA-binding LacI/PurR family transcriptional regulator/CheY-like chemotaxis protein
MANLQSKNKNRLITLGLFALGAGDPCNDFIWSGVSDVCRENNVNLIYYPGRALASTELYESQSNLIYNLVDSYRVDGLIMWLAGLAQWVTTEELNKFCQSYSPLPVVTIGTAVKDVPGILVDNYNGMRDVIRHLVHTHNRKKIAFIRGPQRQQEAEERYQAYLDVLSESGILFDPELVVLGNFKESGGSRAAEILLDDRTVRFDALVGASDNMAVGAMKVLQLRGIQVPGDVAIAGLNDEAPSKYVNPPLTTAPLHFYEQARWAAQMALTMIAGKEVPKKVVLPTQILVRQSCGCLDPLVDHASVGRDFLALEASKKEQNILSENVLAEMSAALSLENSRLSEPVLLSLLERFWQIVDGAGGDGFLSDLQEGLRLTELSGGNLSKWHDVLSVLHRLIPRLALPYQQLRADDILHQGRVLIGETAQRSQAYQVFLASDQARTISEISQELSVALDERELANLLAETMPRLKIPSYFLALYEDPDRPVEFARLVAAGVDGKPFILPNKGCRFSSPKLVPDEFLPKNRPYSLALQPLFFRDDQLGFAIFEADPSQDEICDILGKQISSALKRSILNARNIELYNSAVEARHAAEIANNLKSRFLSVVSHELRTPLSLIVGTLEIMLQEGARREPALPEYYRQDMTCVRTSAQHLSRLIGDVLDLASSHTGDLKLANEPLYLKDILDEALVLGASLAREKALSWQIDIPERLPRVWGDRTRLRQVILNLISNAVKFTEQGEVSVSAEAGEDEVIVTVRDTGLGIPPAEQEWVFDEFRRSERSVARGYSGMGLGLALSRRLIELHGGQIGVTSTGEEEAGSTFFFSLPVFDWPDESEKVARDEDRPVLLLTEHAGEANTLREYLERRGFQLWVLGIRDDPEWLSCVLQNIPGAVVLDFLPATELGWELVNLFKHNPQTREIPVVFYSLIEDQNRGAMFELELIDKPSVNDQLPLALDRLGFVEQARSGKNPVILIVDDDPCVKDMNERIVKAQLPHCTVLTAPNGRVAIEIMQNVRPDLLLLDLMMPEMDGFTLLEHLRQQEMTRDVPVIVLTAQMLSDHDMERLQQGVTAVLQKGIFSAEEVLSQIEVTLKHGKRLGSPAQRLVRRAQAYIHDHFDEEFTRGNLANYLGVNERYLTRCFHEEMRITPISYLNRYRIKQAKQLLEEGEYSITEAAMRVGFADSSYFGRVFRQEMGISPRAYQLTRQNKKA